MHIRPGEEVIKIVKRHLTPFFFKMGGVVLLALPLYFFLFTMYKTTGGDEWVFYLFAFVSFFIGIFAATVALDYILDKLIITNKRVVLVNWKSLFKKEENETDLRDIQDINTKDYGILSRLRIFAFGTIKIETAASKTTILFHDCPYPDGVKHLILGKIEYVKGVK